MSARLVVYRIKDRPALSATSAKGLLLPWLSLSVIQKVSCPPMRHARIDL